MNRKICLPAEIHLVVADAAAGLADGLGPPQAEPGVRPPERAVLPPAAVRRLSISAAGALSLVEPAAPGSGVRVESVLGPGGESRLLLIGCGGAAVQVQGEVAPLMAVLADGDELRLAGGPALRVVVVRRPPTGRANDLCLVGQVCPVCLSGLEPADEVYACVCGAAYHCNPPGSPRLQCARALFGCLACEEKVDLAPGTTPPVRNDYE